MEMRVILKEVKRHTIVCDRCRQIKKRCDGGKPCALCTKHNHPCTHNYQVKRRGRKKEPEKSPSPPLDHPSILWENDLSNYNERSSIISMYREFTLYGCGPDDSLITPKTPSRKMMLSIIMAWHNRIFGDHTKADHHISEARMLAGTLFDNYGSYDTFLAFNAMAQYYAYGHQCTHYASLTFSLAKRLQQKSLHIKRLQFQAYIFTTILEPSLPGPIKYQAILQHPDTLEEGGLSGCMCEVCRKIPKHLQVLILKHFAIVMLKWNVYYDTSVLMCILDTPFTPQEGDVFKACADEYDALMASGVQPWAGFSIFWQFNFKTIKAAILYAEGETEKSKELCLLAATNYLTPQYIYTMSGFNGFMVLLAGLALRLGLIDIAYLIGRKIATSSNATGLAEAMNALPLLDWQNQILQSPPTVSLESNLDLNLDLDLDLVEYLDYQQHQLFQQLQTQLTPPTPTTPTTPTTPDENQHDNINTDPNSNYANFFTQFFSLSDIPLTLLSDDLLPS